MFATKTIFYVIFILLRSLIAPQGGTLCDVDNSMFTWFLNVNVYYLLYDNDTSLSTARCVCQSVADTRLAIFEAGGDYAGVGMFLTSYHSSDQFWVDAERNLEESVYNWANGQTLPLNTDQWSQDEPDMIDTAVRIRNEAGPWKYAGCLPSETFQPLCQSRRAPFNYLPTPPTLTWVSLGALGHMFAFSNEERSLEDARAACEQQAGKVYLATLDTLYDEVSQYILDNHSDRTYWLDAVYNSAAGPSPAGWEWTTGGVVDPDILAPDRSFSGFFQVQNGSSLVIAKDTNTVTKLKRATDTVLNYFVCEGSPAPEATSCTVYPLLTWVPLGSPSRMFGFSEDERTFMEARDACRAQPGKVRLAVLDTLFAEVKEWVEDNQLKRDYWIDATRYPNSVVDLLWGDGKSTTSSQWAAGDPDSDDVVARLKGKSGELLLTATKNYEQVNHYLCERVSEVTLEWRLLGSPGKLFGFSRTPSWGFDWAKDACSRQLGDVTLANLDTHFDDVKQFMENKYPDRQYWVDATRRNGDTQFRWGNGVGVKTNVWMTGEPDARDEVSTMTTKSGSAALMGSSDQLAAFYFVCQGSPAAPDGGTQFPFTCPENRTTAVSIPASTGDGMTSVVMTSARKETTSAVMSSVGEETTSAASDMTSANDETTIPFVTSVDTSPECFSICSCSSLANARNLSEEEIQRIVQDIREDLTIIPTNLSRTIRKLTSAEDQRPSAQAIGSVGIAMLVIPAVFIVLPDILTLIQAVVGKLQACKRRN